MATPPAASAVALTPDRVLGAVEVGGLRGAGRDLRLRVFERRVCGVKPGDGGRVVVKFCDAAGPRARRVFAEPPGGTTSSAPSTISGGRSRCP